MTFQQFMHLVDAALLRRVGMYSADLPDFNYRDAYLDGLTVDETVSDMLAEIGFEDAVLPAPALRRVVEAQCECTACEQSRDAALREAAAAADARRAAARATEVK